MNATTNEHEDILAAIANAAENCGRERPPSTTTPQSAPPQQPDSAPFRQNLTPIQPAAAASYAHPAFQPQGQATAPPQNQAQAVNIPRQQAASPLPVQNQGPSDEEMEEVFDERKKKNFKLGLVANMTILALLITPCIGFTAWYHSSPKNKESFTALMQNFREVPNDVKKMATITESYDEALGELGARGDSINAATLALGVEPSEFEAAAAAKNDGTVFSSEHASKTSSAN